MCVVAAVVYVFVVVVAADAAVVVVAVAVAVFVFVVVAVVVVFCCRCRSVLANQGSRQGAMRARQGRLVGGKLPAICQTGRLTTTSPDLRGLTAILPRQPVAELLVL